MAINIIFRFKSGTEVEVTENSTYEEFSVMLEKMEEFSCIHIKDIHEVNHLIKFDEVESLSIEEV